MVGTRPMISSDFQTGFSASRISLTVWSTRTNVLDVCARRRKDGLGKLRVLLCERGNRTIRQSQRVIADQHLAIALSPCPDSDCGDFQSRGHAAGEIGRY